LDSRIEAAYDGIMRLPVAMLPAGDVLLRELAVVDIPDVRPSCLSDSGIDA